jgi:hypothetical protein
MTMTTPVRRNKKLYMTSNIQKHAIAAKLVDGKQHTFLPLKDA